MLPCRDINTAVTVLAIGASSGAEYQHFVSVATIL